VSQWIQDLLDRWFPGLGETQARILSWVLLGGAAVLILNLALRWFQDRGKAERPSEAYPGATPRPRSAEEWTAWARRAAEAGRLRDAATGVYQATILSLDARGAVRYRDWKTAGDYAVELSDAHALRGPFLDFLGRFVEMAFGPVEPTQEAFEALTAGAARLGSTG
jgi:hypothetical protein